MVKNLKGGKHSKNVARKNVSTETLSSNKLRLSEDPLEVYAVVTKALGNCRFYVNTIDGKQITLHVSSKFRGPQNRVIVGGFLLIGYRDFESPDFKNSDLIEIYTDRDVLALSRIPSINNSFFQLKLDNKTSSIGEITEDDCNFVFSTKDEEPIVAKQRPAPNENMENIFISIDGENVDFDDI